MNGKKGAERLGMDAKGLEAACAAVNRAVEAGTAPGTVLGVMFRGKSWIYAAGVTDPRPRHGEPEIVQANTRYDCASLTKVAVTLPLILQLVDEGMITLSTKAADIVPAFGASGKKEITVGQLLTHTSGLAADMNLHSHGWSREQMWDAVLSSPLAGEPDEDVVYSDLGYLTLGRIAEELLRMPLDQAANQRVFEQLGMRDSTLTPGAEAHGRYAATEYDESSRGHLCGVVHDEKARALGGVCGHAGLFSTAGDLLRYARMWLTGGAVREPRAAALAEAAERAGGAQAGTASRPATPAQVTRILSPAAVRAAVQFHTATIPGANRGLGWVLKGDRMDASGDWMSEGCFGHTGFTGTSLWIDPGYDLAVVLLTNRVYGGRSGSVAELRVQVHNAITAAVLDA